MNRKPTERILADLQAAAIASPEPGQRIAPTGVVVTDANGLSLGAAPNGGLGHEGHAGAYRHIAKCADVLVMLVEREEEEQQALGHEHAINNDVHRNPVVFVQTDQRNIVVRKTSNDDVAVVVVPKNNQNEDEDEEHEDDERR